MDIPQSFEGTATGLPAQHVDSKGRVHVDQRAILMLAAPLVANSAVQIFLHLTDMWFVGHISARALAAVGSVQWLIYVVTALLGGSGMAVQAMVAQYYGARRCRRAAQATWNGLWIALSLAPVFMVVGISSHAVLMPFGIDPRIEQLAAEFWFPRVSTASLAAGIWAMLGFFNGTGRTRITVLISVVTLATNIALNQLFIFQLGWGIAGSAWATAVAQAGGLLLGVAIFLTAYFRHTYGSNLTWRPRATRLLRQLRMGFPVGLLTAGDLLGFSLFQMMQVRLGTVGGAATQMVMMLTTLSYIPGASIAMAGTTLVGQSIGAGDDAWALRVGTRVIALAAMYMGTIGVALAISGPWVLPFFTSAEDGDSIAVTVLGTQLLWLAAAYQFFDGLNLGSAASLRGAGDVAMPTVFVLPASWLIFVPLAHILTFAPGGGWITFLPQLGWGAVGGWVAVLIYVMLLGSMLFLRWRSRAWQKIQHYGLIRRR